MKNISLKANKVKTKNMRKILPLYAKHKKLLVVMVIVLCFSGALGVLTPIFSANSLAMLAEGRFDEALKFAVLMCVTGLFRVIFNAFDELLYVKMDLRLEYDLTNMVIGSINRVKMKKLDETGIGVLAERMSSDVSKITDSYLHLLDICFSILTNVVFLGYIAFLNIYLFLILMGYVLILYVICTIKSRIWIRGRKITADVRDKSRTAYYEQINGIRDVKLLNIKENITNHSNSIFKKSLEIEENVSKKRNLIRRFQSIVTISFELIFLIIGIAFVNKELILLSGLLVVYMYYGRVEGLIGYLSSFKEHKAELEISATRVFEVIEDYEKEEFGEEALTDFSGSVEFKDVDFSYNENEPVLKNMNIKFESGKMTAIVGKSGSGKTTILSLISKLYDVCGGEILLDGKNINDLSESAIHSNIGEISQSPYIFNTSVKQNLLFVKPDATDDELVQVLKDAQIYEDIKKLKEGLNTEIGENGIKLSGGQRQRIAIARLLLMNSKVIVFDEATSALDNESQSKIVDMLEKFKNNKTIIIVAHRLSSIVNADEIYMIEDGSVIANGTHKWLMKNCKQYHELYKLEEQEASE